MAKLATLHEDLNLIAGALQAYIESQHLAIVAANRIELHGVPLQYAQRLQKAYDRVRAECLSEETPANGANEPESQRPEGAG